jgi:NADPH:quinone reductase-like Zn-dependent oxidoreductase
MKGIQLTGYGNPADVVKLADVPSVGSPKPDEIIIDVEAVPVEPSDLYMIAGVYGNLPSLPHFLVEASGRSDGPRAHRAGT